MLNRNKTLTVFIACLGIIFNKILFFFKILFVIDLLKTVCRTVTSEKFLSHFYVKYCYRSKFKHLIFKSSNFDSLIGKIFFSLTSAEFFDKSNFEKKNSKKYQEINRCKYNKRKKKKQKKIGANRVTNKTFYPILSEV